MAEISRSISNWRNQTVLALDTSSTIASLALVQDQQLVATSISDHRFPHSKTLFTSVRLILDAAKVSLANVDIFVGVTGPGSFTGLRIGLAALKGLAHSVERPVYGLDAISAYGLSTKQPGKYLVCLDAGPSTYFVGRRLILDSGELTARSLMTEDAVVYHQKLIEVIQSEPEMALVWGTSRQSTQDPPLPGHVPSRLQDVPSHRITPSVLTLAETVALYYSKHKNLPPLAPYYLKEADTLSHHNGVRLDH